jgi:hypothetical protein
MVLDETDVLFLVGSVGKEREPDAFRVVARQAVGEPLVVAKAESPLLQLPFEIPAGYGTAIYPGKLPEPAPGIALVQ